MLGLTLKDVAEACGGRLAGAADPDAVVQAVVIDSRRAAPGSLFVALRGSRADGHDFAGDAQARGAAALVARDVGGPSIIVDDPLDALGRLAAEVRLRLRAQVVAITGSSGKTCTKDFAAAALSSRYRVSASEESFNNEIGVPLTILGADADIDVVVAEIGARGRGHIAALAPVLRPNVAVVTNVGPAHIGMFGSLDAIAEAKGELVEATGPEGAAILNGDDARVRQMRSRSRGTVVTFGRERGNDVRATEIVLDDCARASFRAETPWGAADVALAVPGEHMVANALAALAVAGHLGAPLGPAAAAVGLSIGPRWRMQIVDAPGGWRVVNDAYNANPASTEAALKALARMGGGSRTWAVIGPMAELGAETGPAHDRIGRLAVRLGIGRLVVVGEEARPTYEAARLEGMAAGEARLAADVDEAVAILRDELEPSDVVLVKASRAAGLERIVERLVEEG